MHREAVNSKKVLTPFSFPYTFRTALNGLREETKVYSNIAQNRRND